MTATHQCRGRGRCPLSVVVGVTHSVSVVSVECQSWCPLVVSCHSCRVVVVSSQSSQSQSVVVQRQRNGNGSAIRYRHATSTTAVPPDARGSTKSFRVGRIMER